MNKGPENNIIAIKGLMSPEGLHVRYPLGREAAIFIQKVRREIAKILSGEDSRFLLVVGPCSIHDPEAGFEYAKKLKGLANRLGDKVMVVMRTYFEKPRTRLGWKGLIMDPFLDGSYNVNEGLRIAREFLLRVVDLGLPTATEFLDPFTPQYIGDLITWAAIGARTVESQTHRLMASGLPMPTGFKNSTEGALMPAIDALKAATQPQTFLGINGQGEASAIMTRGNSQSHLILRGGRGGPNYDMESVRSAQALLEEHFLPRGILIDCAHGNSGKQADKQKEVLYSVMQSFWGHEFGVRGVMLESNLMGGSQDFPQDKKSLEYGTSITDPCLSWEDTEKLLLDVFSKAQMAHS